MRLMFSIAACLPLFCGCVMVEVGVTNPVAGLTTVAIAPFFNLSQERSVDGRRFALAYFAELQKTPGFQVIPVGVVEQTMFDNRLEMNNPDDVLKLSQLLNADAVVVGAVTDYSPYYPPRVGMQVSWYSPRPWQFYPGIPTDEMAREFAKPPHRFNLFKRKRCKTGDCAPEEMVITSPTTPPTVMAPRGQSPDDEMLEQVRPISLPEFLLFGESGVPRRLDNRLTAAEDITPQELGMPELPGPETPPSGLLVNPLPGQMQLQRPEAFDPTQPLMSYTRMFDGADPLLTARLRDYVELSGNLRAGGWEAYLQRSEDFIRFSAHVMIVEMLQLHGGEARKRVVFKLRKYR